MDYQEKIDKLKKYTLLNEKIDFYKNKLYSISGVVYGKEVVKGGNRTSLINRIDDIEIMEKEMAIIKDAIKRVEDFKLQSILEYRYLLGIPLNEISDHMNYSYTHTKRLHEKAVNEIVFSESNT